VTYVLAVSVCVCVCQVRRHVRPRFQSSRSWSLTYDVLTFVTTRVAIAYITVPFVLLEFWTSVEFYRLVALYSAETQRHFRLSTHYRSVTVLSIQERHRDISVSLHNRPHRETFQSLCTLQVSDSTQHSAKTQRHFRLSAHYRSVTVLSTRPRHTETFQSLYTLQVSDSSQHSGETETFPSLCTLQDSDSSQHSAKTQRDISVSLHTTGQ